MTTTKNHDKSFCEKLNNHVCVGVDRSDNQAEQRSEAAVHPVSDLRKLLWACQDLIERQNN